MIKMWRKENNMDSKTYKSVCMNINSYIKLKSQEIREFSKHDIFDKKSTITDWEKINTL